MGTIQKTDRRARPLKASLFVDADNLVGKDNWTKKHHAVVCNIARGILYPFARLKYHAKMERFKEQGDRQYLILYNHQTAYDQFFVGMIFKGPLYYLATEDLFSNGLTSWLIKKLVAPIPIKKQMADISAIRNCMQVVKEGGTLVIAPEGNRTYTGRTVYINPSIGGLAKKLGLPIALVRIEGGYGVDPRWAGARRKGKMHVYVSRVIEPEEIETLSKEELYQEIKTGLWQDDAAQQGTYKSKKRAEYIERAIYACPRCRALGKLESRDELIYCTGCGLRAEYTEKLEIIGQNYDLPFHTAAGWIDWQNDVVNGMNPMKHTEKPLFCDIVQLFEEIVYKKKILRRKSAAVALYGDRITVDEGGPDEMVFPFSETRGVTVLNRHTVNVYFGDKVWQMQGDERFNALKYVNFYYRYQNWRQGDNNGEFLGH